VVCDLPGTRQARVTFDPWCGPWQCQSMMTQTPHLQVCTMLVELCWWAGFRKGTDAACKMSSLLLATMSSWNNRR
jgi:hypothetical protein